MKTKITSSLLLKEYSSAPKIVLFSIFVIAGLFCFICPIFYCEEINNLLTNMAFMLIIAIPFCGIGIKNIVNIVSKKNCIKRNDFVVDEDVVVKKRMIQQGTSKNTSDSYCQLDFEKYSAKTGKAVVVKRSVYEETHKGDLFYMIYVKDKLIGFYPQSKYELP